MIQKRFDYCTIAGKNPAAYWRHVDNVLRNSGMHRDAWEFHTIVYTNSRIEPSVTNEILRIADDNGITTHLYQEVEGTDYETFLHNLYSCWHLCQILGDTPLAMRAGSDQAFSKDAFKNILACWDEIVTQNKNEDLILFHNCIECKDNVSESRHILENFGRNWHEFNEEMFQNWCQINQQAGPFDWNSAVGKWGAPKNLPGCPMNGSADGCSWLQTKALYRKFGPMAPRMEYGTGDITLMMRYRNAGIPIRICGDSTTYHLSRSGA